MAREILEENKEQIQGGISKSLYQRLQCDDEKSQSAFAVFIIPMDCNLVAHYKMTCSLQGPCEDFSLHLLDKLLGSTKSWALAVQVL